MSIGSIMGRAIGKMALSVVSYGVNIAVDYTEDEIEEAMEEELDRRPLSEHEKIRIRKAWKWSRENRERFR